MIWVIIGILIIAFICVMAYNVKASMKWYQDKEEIKKGLSTIKESLIKVENDLKANGMENGKRYSSFGYRFIEYRNKYNQPDNLNIIMDDTQRKMALYLLLPYHFEIINYSDVVDVKIEDKTTIQKGQDIVESVFVHIIVKQENEREIPIGLSANDNIGCIKGDENYKKAYTQARQFESIIRNIIKNNEEKA